VIDFRFLRALFRPILESTQGPVSLGFLLVLVGCAAQDAQRLYTRAQKQLLEAQAQHASDKRLGEAEEAFKAGEEALSEAVFDKAHRNLRRSLKLTDEILEGHQRAPAAASAPAADGAASRLSLPAPKALGSSTAPSSTARGLPRDALAKYLAGKRGVQQIAPPPIAPIETTSAPADKVPAVEVTNPAQGAIQSSAAEKSGDGVGEGVVASSAAALDKIKAAPAAPAPAPSVVKAPAAPAPKPSTTQNGRRETAGSSLGEKPMTKIPGALRFGSQEVSLDAETMMNLNQTSKFLLENPSTTLVLRGFLGPGESAGLVDSRYESVRAYLIGKGVPEDQVRLDARRQAGARSEFEMFLLEH
jgi:outer membrane protein OmpA-like peptidoglycan-associated protein